MFTIGENIKYLRESRKWTKLEMSQRLGFKSYSTISKWESGENHPKGSELKKLCELFNVSSDYLLGLDKMNEGNGINYYKYYPISVSAGLLESIDSIKEDDIKWITMTDDAMGKYAGASDIFFVNVSGTSMNKVIEPNSRIAIKPINSIELLKERDIVLFSKDNQFSVKRFYIDNELNRFIFRPESTDKSHTDIVISQEEANDIIFYGKVILNIVQFS